MKHRAGSASSSSSSSGAGKTMPKSGKGGNASKGGKAYKGKGKCAQSATGSSGGQQGPAIDLKDLPLHLCQYEPEDDLCNSLPRYHAVLRRAESYGVTLEDIDQLQLELEAMLAHVVLRKDSLREELGIISNIDKYKGQSSKIDKAKRGGPSSPGKRGAAFGPGGGGGGGGSGQDRSESNKRFRPSMSSAGKPGSDSMKILVLPKVKSEQSMPQFDPLQNEQIRPAPETPKPTLPKNETPNRFWAFVEPYCAPISVDDIKLLEDLIKTHGDLTEYFRIPPLGQHYTVRWAKEDLDLEKQKSSAVASADNSGSEAKSGDEAARLKKSDPGEEKTPFGEMTQRIVAGLMEENIMTSIDEADLSKKGSGVANEDSENKNQLIKSLNIGNSEALEARVRKELEEQGILNPNEVDSAGAVENNDEIFDELKRCQNELRAVSAHNLAQLRRLLKAAKEELVRQELRNKLATADAEVMDAYQKVSLARSKKKVPTKKERDLAWKALKERELILKELENS